MISPGSLSDEPFVFESRLDFEKTKIPHSTRSNMSAFDGFERSINQQTTFIESSTSPLLIATDEEKKAFFHVLKSYGFTQEMRREVWLLCSGARMAMYNSITQGTVIAQKDDSI